MSDNDLDLFLSEPEFPEEDELDFHDDPPVDWGECPTCGHHNHEDDLLWCEECGTRLLFSEEDDE